MNMGFDNKVALVTGAGSGMGLAAAQAFAEEGAAVALVDINEGAARTAAGRLDVFGAPPGATFRMTLSGSHLALAQVSFSGNGITAVPSSGSETGGQIDVSVTADARFGPQTMTITTRSGSTSACGQKPCSFTVLADVGSWVPTGPFHDTRSSAAIVRLLDGRVLIAGGGSSPQRATASAEIFDPATLQWTLKRRYALINKTTKAAPQVSKIESVGLRQSSGARQNGGSRLTAAGRKKLSDLMKKRWAAKRRIRSR